jgi:hypothetical protein|nr:hypothetical protein [uncultured Actinotalea sp.]
MDRVDEEPLHMWRLVGMRMGDVPEPGTLYRCELCGEDLLVPPRGVHPEEC